MLEEKKLNEMSDEEMSLVVGGSDDERSVSNGACRQSVTLDFRGLCNARTAACKCWYNVSGDA